MNTTTTNTTNDMTRQEFSQMLVDAKSGSEIYMQDALPFAFALGPKRCEIIENASEDYTVESALLYLRMCGCCISFGWTEYINTMPELREAVIKARKEDCEYSINKLAQYAGVSASMLRAFEEGRAGIKIDALLKISDALGALIEIE